MTARFYFEFMEITKLELKTKFHEAICRLQKTVARDIPNLMEWQLHPAIKTAIEKDFSNEAGFSALRHDGKIFILGIILAEGNPSLPKNEIRLALVIKQKLTQ